MHSSVAKLRWRILRKFLLPEDSGRDDAASKISRVPSGSFNLISSNRVSEGENDLWEYTLGEIKLYLSQTKRNGFKLEDHEICRKLGIDNTGIVCLWSAEEILTYYCISHPELFRNKKIIELGSGYGLAGLAIAACTEAAEVYVSDGNPKVVDYAQKNIIKNSQAFGNSQVNAGVLYWSKEAQQFTELPKYDIIIAADCTYFENFHEELACTIKQLMNPNNGEAMLFCPARGKSLQKFVDVVKGLDLRVVVNDRYDDRIRKLHKEFEGGGDGDGDEMKKLWPNYDSNHSYPLFISIKS